MGRACRRCPGKILARMMGGRRLGGGRARGKDGGRRAEGGGGRESGRRAEDGGRRTRISAEGGVRRPALNMWVSVGAAGHLRMVARTRALKLAVRLGRTAQ